MKKTTVGELGDRLPIGIRHSGKLTKTFALRPYKGRIDRVLAAWEEAARVKHSSPGVLLAAKVAKFVSLICSQYGDRAFALTPEGDSTPESELLVYQMWQADVFYLYYLARVSSLGPDLEVDFACPACSRKSIMTFDLKSATVDTIEDGDPMEVSYKLKRPFKSRDNKLIRTVRMQPPSWSCMLKPSVFSGSIDSVIYGALGDMLCGCDVAEGIYQFSPEELDSIERVDAIGISRATNELAAGIDLSTTVACPHEECGFEAVNPLNWSHDHFFGTSLPVLAKTGS